MRQRSTLADAFDAGVKLAQDFISGENAKETPTETKEEVETKVEETKVEETKVEETKTEEKVEETETVEADTKVEDKETETEKVEETKEETKKEEVYTKVDLEKAVELAVAKAMETFNKSQETVEKSNEEDIVVGLKRTTKIETVIDEDDYDINKMYRNSLKKY